MPAVTPVSRPSAATFANDERGTIAMIFGLSLAVLLGLAGLTIDGGRAYSAKAKASSALDAAVLAAAKAMSEQGLSGDALNDVGKAYFDANTQGKGGASFDNFQITADPQTQTLSATVDTSLNTLFGGFFNINTVNFSTAASATYNTLDLELALMLDVTGSMNSNGKLKALKKAVKTDLVDVLITPNMRDGAVKIGFAPYSAAVNAGVHAAAVTGHGGGDGCVVERTMQTDQETAPIGGNYFRDINDADATISQDQNNNGHYNFYVCPNAEVLPITDDADLLKQTIDGYSASGRTAGHLGIAWAWYLISPEWAPVWPAQSQPKPYGTQNLMKAVVLLTDGEFNASYGGSDYWVPAKNEAYFRTSKLCDNIRDKNIVVFSIGFDLKDKSAIDALKECASINEDTGTKFYYPSANEEELRKAFRDIAIQLGNLRLAT